MTFVELPQEVQFAVVALVTALTILAINALIAYAPWLKWIEPYKEEWAEAAGIGALALLQNALPGGEYTQISILAVQLLLAIIAVVMGTVKFLARRGAAKLL